MQQLVSWGNRVYYIIASWWKRQKKPSSGFPSWGTMDDKIWKNWHKSTIQKFFQFMEEIICNINGTKVRRTGTSLQDRGSLCVWVFYSGTLTPMIWWIMLCCRIVPYSMVTPLLLYASPKLHQLFACITPLFHEAICVVVDRSSISSAKCRDEIKIRLGTCLCHQPFGFAQKPTFVLKTLYR